jgi:hypothetical protein
MTTTPTSWHALTVYSLLSGAEAREDEAVEALAEFIRTGGMAGYSFADPSSSTDEECTLGGPTGPESVDWTGFPDFTPPPSYRGTWGDRGGEWAARGARW